MTAHRRQPLGRGTGRARSKAPDAISRALEATESHDRAEMVSVAVLAAQKPRKYRNQPVEINGIRFDSQKEGKRYDELRFMARNGVIRDLEVHPRFPLVVHGEDCGVYVGDFAWIDPETGERVVEDVKSAATRKLPTYRLKSRLLWAIYGLRIREV